MTDEEAWVRFAAARLTLDSVIGKVDQAANDADKMLVEFRKRFHFGTPYRGASPKKDSPE
jgi:hypothetical protein